LTMPREQLHRRIRARAERMFQGGGLLEEVRTLRQSFPEFPVFPSFPSAVNTGNTEGTGTFAPTSTKAIGYEEAAAVLDGAMALPQAIERTVIRTRQLAKRQETWFRHQAHAVWLEISEHEPTEDVARRVLELWRHYGPTPIRIPSG